MVAILTVNMIGAGMVVLVLWFYCLKSGVTPWKTRIARHQLCARFVQFLHALIKAVLEVTAEAWKVVGMSRLSTRYA